MLPVAEPVAALPGAFIAVRAIGDPDRGLLLPSEQQIFDGLLSETRKREWWSGRMAARAALRACGAGAAAVLRDEKGAPRLEGPHADQVTVAITHGKHTAAAIAARLDARHPYVGIDLVDPDDQARVAKVAHRFLKPSEHAIVALDPSALLLCWSAREAVAKATQTGMFMFALARSWIESMDPVAQTITVNVPGLALAYRTLPGGERLVIAGATPEARAVVHASLIQTG